MKAGQTIYFINDYNYSIQKGTLVEHRGSELSVNTGIPVNTGVKTSACYSTLIAAKIKINELLTEAIEEKQREIDKLRAKLHVID